MSVSDLDHTCDGGTKMNRGIKMEVLKEVVPEIKSFISDHGQRAKDVRKVAKSASNVRIKPGQAAKIAKSVHGDPEVNAVAQFHLIEAYIGKLVDADQGGTYIIDVDENHAEGRQFHHHYVATSAAKAFWRHCHRGVVAVDATFLTGPLKGTLFLCVTKDANNQLVLLSFGQYQKENASNWAGFMRQVKRDFPGIRVTNCDKQKGLEHCRTAYGLLDIQFCRCAKHLIDNAVESKETGKVTSELENLCWGMVKAATADVYDYFMKKIAAKNQQLADWMDAAKDEYANHVFLAKNIHRFGDTTSNMAEQHTNILMSQGIREMPIVDMTGKLITYSSQAFVPRKENAAKMPDDKITQGAFKIVEERYAESSVFETSFLSFSHSEIVAQVQIPSNPPRTFLVKLHQNGNRANAKCPCGVYREWGLHCNHVMDVLSEAQEKNSAYARSWDWTDVKWADKVWHASTVL